MQPSGFVVHSIKLNITYLLLCLNDYLHKIRKHADGNCDSCNLTEMIVIVISLFHTFSRSRIL